MNATNEPLPSTEQIEAAQEFLNEWVDDASTGVWAALAELLAKRERAAVKRAFERAESRR